MVFLMRRKFMQGIRNPKLEVVKIRRNLCYFTKNSRDLNLIW